MIAVRAAVVVVLVTAAAVARGDVTPEDAAAATALFEEGRVLIDAGKVDAACEKFEASLRKDRQSGTKLNLGDCRQLQGRLAEALALFEEGAADAEREGKTGRLAFAKKQIAALLVRVARVILRVAEPELAGLTIQLTSSTGTRDLPRSTWPSQHLVDAALPVVVMVAAPGRKPARIERVVAGGEQLVIDVPVLEVDASGVIGRDSPPAGPPRSRSRAPLIVAGSGVALLAGAAMLGLTAKRNYDNATTLPEIRSAQRRADIATVVTATGVVALTVAIVWHYRRRGDRVVVVPTASANGAGVAAGGVF